MELAANRHRCHKPSQKTSVSFTTVQVYRDEDDPVKDRLAIGRTRYGTWIGRGEMHGYICACESVASAFSTSFGICGFGQFFDGSMDTVTLWPTLELLSGRSTDHLAFPHLTR
jgi:hypothetical protein